MPPTAFRKKYELISMTSSTCLVAYRPDPSVWGSRRGKEPSSENSTQHGRSRGAFLAADGER